MAAMNFASTACSAGNRGQLADALSQWHATATAAGRASIIILCVPPVRSPVAQAVSTAKIQDIRPRTTLALVSYLSLLADWFSLYY
ncbi:hypothetical protein FPRO06_07962 [Fusarium proliferatum]|nr:hypothetical protein FPRO06_07962 [Fusarium proliferatum]